MLVGFAMTAALGNCVRHLMSNPDVCVTKAKRDNFLHYSEEQGAEWQSKRRSLATIQKNVINQTFEDEDANTFPIVFLVGLAMTAAIGNGARYLVNNPDVCLDKSKRNNFMHYNEDQGSDWRARRFRFANIKKNPINQSRQFDPAFEKDENKSVHRD
ncbi:hypothetical protein PF010_g23208 [Phytophthora fragariae]|nr:hypothetical protein PF010_g23208 [Phytophthora fragariae]